MSQVTDIPKSSSTSWQSILGWVAAAGAVIAVILVLREMFSSNRLKAKGFGFYPQDIGDYVLPGLIGLIGLLFLTSYIGKLIGERARRRPISYSAVLTDQLTHVFFWIVIIFALYPIFYVFSASFDPLNRLVQSSFGADTAPLAIRARILPSFDGASLENYAKLFEGVTIYTWQWALAGIAVIGVLGLIVMWFLVQQNGGVSSPKLQRARSVITWMAVLATSAFFLLLTPDQFDGYSKPSKFLLWLRNTFLISGITGVLTVALTTTTGYALARLRFPGRYQFLLFLIFIQMFPALLGFVAVFNLISELKLLNSFPGLILAYSGGAIAFGTWTYKGYVESLPASLEEAALVDGCTRWTAFTRIVLPLSGPMLVFIFLLQFVGTYSEFFLANVLLTGAENWNIGVGLKSLAPVGFDTTQFGAFSAAAVLGALPIVILYYSFQQVFVSGTLSGGVKE